MATRKPAAMWRLLGGKSVVEGTVPDGPRVRLPVEWAIGKPQDLHTTLVPFPKTGGRAVNPLLMSLLLTLEIGSRHVIVALVLST